MFRSVPMETLNHHYIVTLAFVLVHLNQMVWDTGGVRHDALTSGQHKLMDSYSDINKRHQDLDSVSSTSIQ